MSEQQFHKVLAPLLEQKLKKISTLDTKLNLAACVEIYQMIFDTIAGIIEGAEVPLSNEAVNYISQQYYDGVLINGRYDLDPNIFSQRAKLENMDRNELKLVASLLRGTDFIHPVIEALKR